MKRACVLLSLIVAVSATLVAQGPRKETVDGVRNFTVVDPTIGCAGATEVAAIPALASRGYRAIINLREATEAGAAIDESQAAAARSGLRYVHLPFSAAKPDPAMVDAFIKAIGDPANQPAFIHCASANRVGAMMMAKRMTIDGWPEARAYDEAAAIGLTSAPLRQFVIEYVTSRKK